MANFVTPAEAGVSERICAGVRPCWDPGFRRDDGWA